MSIYDPTFDSSLFIKFLNYCININLMPIHKNTRISCEYLHINVHNFFKNLDYALNFDLIIDLLAVF